MIAGPSPVFSTNSDAPFGVTNVEISTCGQTSARSWARWSCASYNPTATAETLTTRAATAMNVSGSRYQGRSPFIRGGIYRRGERQADAKLCAKKYANRSGRKRVSRCPAERRRSESNRRIEVLHGGGHTGPWRPTRCHWAGCACALQPTPPDAQALGLRRAPRFAPRANAHALG